MHTFGQASEGYTCWFSEGLSNLTSWSLALQVLSLAKRCNVVKHDANEHFCWFMPQIGALGVSSPLLFFTSPFVSSFDGNKQKKVYIPLTIIYWADTESGELLVNSSFFLYSIQLQEVETAFFWKRSLQTCPLVSSGCFCTSTDKGKLLHWSEQHQAHSHLQHWSALKYN